MDIRLSQYMFCLPLIGIHFKNTFVTPPLIDSGMICPSYISKLRTQLALRPL